MTREIGISNLTCRLEAETHPTQRCSAKWTFDAIHLRRELRGTFRRRTTDNGATRHISPEWKRMFYTAFWTTFKKHTNFSARYYVSHATVYRSWTLKITYHGYSSFSMVPLAVQRFTVSILCPFYGWGKTSIISIINTNIEHRCAETSSHAIIKSLHQRTIFVACRPLSLMKWSKFVPDKFSECSYWRFLSKSLQTSWTTFHKPFDVTFCIIYDYALSGSIDNYTLYDCINLCIGRGGTIARLKCASDGNTLNSFFWGHLR